MGLILGTGVGGGIVQNGKSITGHSYITGEFGHIRLPVDALEVVGVIFRSSAAAAASLAALKTIYPVAGLPGCITIFINSRSLHRRLWPCGSREMKKAREHVERYLDLLAVCLGNILTIVDPGSAGARRWAIKLFSDRRWTSAPPTASFTACSPHAAY